MQQAWQQWLNKLPPNRREDDDVREIRWMIEELRVSFFAQQLGTRFPISDKRVLQAMEQHPIAWLVVPGGAALLPGLLIGRRPRLSVYPRQL